MKCTSNAEVVGSSPAGSSKKENNMKYLVIICLLLVGCSKTEIVGRTYCEILDEILFNKSIKNMEEFEIEEMELFVPFIEKDCTGFPNSEYCDNMIEDPCFFIRVNFPPHVGMEVSITKIDGEKVVVLHKDDEFTRVYYPASIKKAVKAIKEDRTFDAFVVDGKFWFYEEKVFGFNPIMSFGMDMTMPFIAANEWQEFEF